MPFRVKAGSAKKSRLDTRQYTGDACFFCHSSVKTDVSGELLTRNVDRALKLPVASIVAHYACVYFSSNLSQTEDEEDPQHMWGFSLKDIWAELMRTRSIKCKYCEQSNASIGCEYKKCKMLYHFLCGVNHQALYNWRTFICWCSKHAPEHYQPELATSESGERGDCVCCSEEIEHKVSAIVLYSPCCRKFLHRSCVQQQATSAGAYHFKCPFCNDVQKYPELECYGVWIPQRDAQWETSGAFSDLNASHLDLHCSAGECLCPDGPNYETSRFRMLNCFTCGYFSVHDRCFCQGADGDVSSNGNYTCPDCHLGSGDTPATERPRVFRAASRVTPAGRRLSINVVEISDDESDMSMEPPYVTPGSTHDATSNSSSLNILALVDLAETQCDVSTQTSLSWNSGLSMWTTVSSRRKRHAVTFDAAS